MNIVDRKIYSEVYSVITLLGEKYINRIPEKLLKFIKHSKLDTYSPRYTLEMDLDKQEIQKQSLALIALINYKYWAENEQEKKEIFSLIKKEN